MPHLYIPEIILSKEDYEMIQDNQVPIDAYVANRIREESMFVSVSYTHLTLPTIYSV